MAESCFSSYIIVLATLIYLLLVSQYAMAMDSISVDLIHRDSPLSPFYNNPSITNLDRLHNAFHRSIARINNRFNTQSQSLTTIYSGGEYFMNISIGTPPVVIPGGVDTGSDLTWTQCKPCIDCFKQLSPMFDPKQSSTYIEYPCESIPCKAVRKCNFCTPQNICGYNCSYEDGSYTIGRVATETISIGSVSLPDIFFGCGYNNVGLYDEQGSGIIGLGRGPLSFINQFLPSLGHKFSHCLVPITTSSSTTSKIYFGADSVVSGDGVVSTPMVAKGTDISFYYLVLESVSVGENRIMPLKDNKLLLQEPTTKNHDQDGNIIVIIDSGTQYTLLPNNFYDDLVVAIDEVIGGERVQEPYGGLTLCYRTDDDIDAPIVTFHFSGNADVRLKTANTFIRMTVDVVCLTIAPTTDDVGVYGNLSQVNFLVGYDLDNQIVSFKPTDCSIQ